VRVCEANDAAIKELGVTTDTEVSQVFQEVGVARSNADGSVDESDSFPFSHFDVGQLGGLNRTGGLSFEAVLHAQQEAGNVKVLSQPVITTTDGKQAIWFAGESVPYIAEPQVSTGSNFQAPKVKYIKVGVTLSFKPRLDRDGLITIDANPIVSSLVEFIDLGAGASAPRLQNRQSHSTVRVHDGETFSLAGLITENERKRTIKVPGFGDLPIVGSLFRDKRTERNRTEIIVLVTPKIVE
jgi:Flp pilus assembly secretin CpaC